MNIHKNARLTPRGREHTALQVLSGQTPEAAARAAGVCPRTARKWRKRDAEPRHLPVARLVAQLAYRFDQ